MKVELPGLSLQDLQDLGNLEPCVPVTLDELVKSRKDVLEGLQNETIHHGSLAP
jgi:hypothetical protein